MERFRIDSKGNAEDISLDALNQKIAAKLKENKQKLADLTNRSVEEVEQDLNQKDESKIEEYKKKLGIS